MSTPRSFKDRKFKRVVDSITPLLGSQRPYKPLKRFEQQLRRARTILLLMLL